MKKLLALLLALIMLFSVATVFAGCEDDSKKSNASKNDDDDEEEDEDEDKDNSDDDDTTKPGDGDDGNITNPDNQDDDNNANDDINNDVNSATADYLVGKWTATINIGELLNSLFAMMFGSDFSGSSLNATGTYCIELNSDGTGSISLELDEENTALYLDQIIPMITEMVYGLYESQGISRETLNDEFMADYNMTLEEYYRENFNYETLSQSFSEGENFVYAVDEEAGRIYKADNEEGLNAADAEYLIYEYSNGTLTVIDMFDGESFASDDAESSASILFPMVMEKQ